MEDKLYDGNYVPINLSPESVYVTIEVNFDELDSSISKTLTIFDKMVYIAIYALSLQGYITMTATQIYHVWKPDTTPGKKELTEINASLAKMAFTDVCSYYGNCKSGLD